MSAETVILAALNSDDAKRTSGLDELATLLVDALDDANLLVETSPRRCRSLYQPSSGVERFVRCTLDRGHDVGLLHSGQQSSTTPVRWAGEQAAGVFRERL